MYPKLLAATLAALSLGTIPASAVEVNFEFLETQPGEWDVLAEVIPQGGDTLGINGYAFNIVNTDSNAIEYNASRLTAVQPDTFRLFGFARPANHGVVGRGSPNSYYSVGHDQATSSGETEILGIGIEEVQVESLGGALQVGVPALLGKLKTPENLTANNFESPELSLFPGNYSGLQNTRTFGVYHNDSNFNLKVTSYAELQSQPVYTIEFNEVERGVFDVLATVDPRQSGIQGIAGYSYNLGGEGSSSASVAQSGLGAIDPASMAPIGFPQPTITQVGDARRVAGSQATPSGQTELFGIGIEPVTFDGLDNIQAGVPVRLSRITVPEDSGSIDISDFELSLFPAGYNGLDGGSLLTANAETRFFQVTENRLPPVTASRTTPSLYPRLTEISPGVWEVSARISDFSSGVTGLADYSFELTGIDPAEVTFEQGNLSGVEQGTLAPRGFTAPQLSVVDGKVTISSSQATASGNGEIHNLGVNPVDFDGQGSSDVTSPDRVVLGTLTTPTGQAPRNFGNFRLGLLPAGYSGSAATPVESYTTADDNVTLDVQPFVQHGSQEQAELRFVETDPGEWQVFFEAHDSDIIGLLSYNFVLLNQSTETTRFEQQNLATLDGVTLELNGFREPFQESLDRDSLFAAGSSQTSPDGSTEIRGIGIESLAIDGVGLNDIDVDSSALIGKLYTTPGLTPESFSRSEIHVMESGYSGPQSNSIRKLDYINRSTFNGRNLLGVHIFPLDYVAPQFDLTGEFNGDVSLTDDAMLSTVDQGSELQSRTTTVSFDDGVVRMALSVTLTGFDAAGAPLAVQADSTGQLGVGDGVLDQGESITVAYNSVEFSLVEGADPSLVDFGSLRAALAGFGVAGDFAEDDDTIALDGLLSDDFDSLVTDTGSLLGLRQSSAITPGASFTLTAQSGGFGLQSLAHSISYNEVAAVPEPSTIALAALAFAAPLLARKIH